MSEETIYMLSNTPEFEDEAFEPTYRQHPAIANSDLKYLHSPKLFQLNKQQQLEEESNPAFYFGTFIDDYLLSEDFNEKYILDEGIESPSSPNQKKFLDLIMTHEGDLNTADIASYYGECYAKPNEDKALELYNSLQPYILFSEKSKGKTVYSEDDLDKAKNIVHNIQNHELLNDWIFEDKVKDQARFSHLQIVDKEFWGVKWKGELDRVIVDFNTKEIYNLDLKSTSKPISNFHYSYRNYRYYRQQALYRKLLLAHLVDANIIEDASEWLVKTRVMIVQSVFPYEVGAAFIPNNVLVKGEQELEECAELIKYYDKNGWDRTKSYRENNYCEVYDWSEVFDNF